MINIAYTGNVLSIDGKDIQCKHEIIDAFEVNNVIVVFFDPDGEMGEIKQYHNLVGFELSGQILWEAELPTKNKSDVYWKLESKKPLKAYSFSSHECEIDFLTGKILNSVFYK